MKKILRGLLIYTLILYFLPQIIPGFHIDDGFITLFIGGAFLALMFLVLKPIINIISLPINLITVGLFSLFINTLLIYILTVFISGISISPFDYYRMDFLGFTTPRIHFSLIFAYLYTSFILTILESFTLWLIK